MRSEVRSGESQEDDRAGRAGDGTCALIAGGWVTHFTPRLGEATTPTPPPTVAPPASDYASGEESQCEQHYHDGRSGPDAEASGIAAE